MKTKFKYILIYFFRSYGEFSKNPSNVVANNNFIKSVSFFFIMVKNFVVFVKIKTQDQVDGYHFWSIYLIKYSKSFKSINNNFLGAIKDN